MSAESVMLPPEAALRPSFNALRHTWEHQPLHAQRGFALLHAVAHRSAPSFVRREVNATRVLGTVGPIIGEVTMSSASVVIEARRQHPRLLVSSPLTPRVAPKVSAPVRLELVLKCHANAAVRRVARWCEPHAPVLFPLRSLKPDTFYTFKFEVCAARRRSDLNHST